ncbi:MAG: M3 family oligoendopeptidase [Thermoanaerobaculia bacterium]|nr:M3 family oligoendopeptidase [Thermoanaerobaculia bacterium]
MTTVAESTTGSYAPGGWDLSDLLEDTGEERVVHALASVVSRVEELEQCRPELDAMRSARLVEMVGVYEAIIEEMAVLGAHAGLWFSADTQDSRALAFRNRVQRELTGLQNRILFFSLWWKGLDDARVAELMPGADAHPDTVFYLEDLRRQRQYSLEESTEQLINTKDADGIGGLMTVYSMLTNRLTFELEVDGERQELTRDELMNYALSPDGGLREAAYRELGRVLERESKILAQIYTHRVRDWHSENVSLRGYASPIAVRNVANDIPDAAVQALLECVEEGAGIFHRYFALKASWLGSDRLRRYDLYAPLSSTDRRVEYGEAVASVLDTFASFDPAFAASARRVFDEGHIDSEPRPGKRMGAFCASVLPRLTPWVLVNFNGRVRDVATLAHELGHAVHGMLAHEHSVLTHHPSLPLAETASVFAEMLMTERLLAEEERSDVRREILATAVDDIYATVMRQAFFVRFEEAAHRAILDNASAEDLCDLYAENLERQFGDSVELGPEFRLEWLGIPHIYTSPFYCYAYSFGQLLVLSLFRRYQEDPQGFRPGYLRMLSYGGAARPERILAEAGIDPADRDFWRGGLEVVSGMIDQLAEL